MANKKKKPSAGKVADSSDENVVRIKAGSSSSSKKTAKAESVAAPAAVAAKKPASAKVPKAKAGIRGLGFLGSIGGYFKGAWTELRQVRWPNRRATWSLTGAVLAYSAFFVVLVLLLDAAFKVLFDFILKK